MKKINKIVISLIVILSILGFGIYLYDYYENRICVEYNMKIVDYNKELDNGKNCAYDNETDKMYCGIIKCVKYSRRIENEN